MSRAVTILTTDPIVSIVAEMSLVPPGIETMVAWVRTHRPECLPDEYVNWESLFPHEIHSCTDNELLVELAGRKCYDSFGLKAGRKDNAEYIANTQGGAVQHASILYHAKISLFIAGLSRRASHEFIRNYVGSDRDEEGSPSQESTRFTHHYGYFVAPVRRVGDPSALEAFRDKMQVAYDGYCDYIDEETEGYRNRHGKAPTGMERKRIYEDAAGELPQQAETSFIWTTNPMAAAKFVREREDEVADLEMQRFARVVRQTIVKRYPGLFPQPWMKNGPAHV
jgi:thymidylate synthase (FAD)